VSEIIAYRAYFAFVCAGCIGIIAGNVFVGVSQIRLHIRAAAIAFTCRLRCGREEKRREEKKVFCGLDSFSAPYIGLTG
ncbi:TPA: hypothetical protein WN483_002007, partial [Neisseria gonorrhoeae]